MNKNDTLGGFISVKRHSRKIAPMDMRKSHEFIKMATASEVSPGYTVFCPVCEKRAFDISEMPNNDILISLKCPHCRKIIQMPFYATMNYSKL